MKARNRLRLALFDLDHTLLPIDSDYAWGVFTQEIGWTDPVVFQAAQRRVLRALQGRHAGRPRLRAVRHRSGAAARTAQGQAAHEPLHGRGDPPGHPAEALALVRRHQARRRAGGHRHRHQRVRHRARSPAPLASRS